MLRCRIVWVVTLAAGAGADALCAADKPSLHLSGSTDLLWRVAETDGPASETARLHFAWRRPGKPKFHPPVAPVRGVVDRVTARGEWLHVLYADGSHWLCTRQRLQPAANLPHRAKKPLAWAGSSDGAMLYAVVPGQVLAAVAATQPTTTRAAESQPSAPLTRTRQGRDGARGLVEFARQKWRRAEALPLPPWADDPTEFLMMAADSDAVHLFYRRSNDDLMYARWNVAPEPAEPAVPRWSEPVSTGLRPASVAAAMVVNKRLLVVFAEPVPNEPGRVTLRIARPAEPTWNADRVLHVDQTDQPFDQTFDEASVVVTSVAQTIAVAQKIGDDEVEVSVWEPATGARLGDPRTEPIAASGGPTVGEEMANWLLLATVLLLFVAAIRRRQLSRPRQDKSDS